MHTRVAIWILSTFVMDNNGRKYGTKYQIKTVPHYVVHHLEHMGNNIMIIATLVLHILKHISLK